MRLKNYVYHASVTFKNIKGFARKNKTDPHNEAR